MKNYIIPRSVLLLLFVIISKAIFAQIDTISDSQREDAINVFIDCRFCDEQYIRQEIPFVNYVRDTREAQVYILVTRQRSGSGGNEYTFLFQGQKNFEGINDTLIYSSEPNSTRDNTRLGRTQTLKLGLIRYISHSPLAKLVDINFGFESEPEVVEDRWKSWVFNVQLEGSFNGQKSLRSRSYETSFSARKITPDWKIELYGDHEYDEDKYEIDEEFQTYIRKSTDIEGLIVKSLGDHWSFGGFYEISSSSYNNTDFQVVLYPAIEYNVFKYSESTRKQLRFLYGIGMVHSDYTDTTLYDKTIETLFAHTLNLSMEIKQKWGSASAHLSGMHYFHDLTFNNMNFGSSLNFRLFKGFSLGISGNITLIHDQLSLPKEDASVEDILLKQRQLATQFRYHFRVGISYSFGSIYNNVVNPRFGD